MYFISKNILDKLLQRLIASEIDYNRLRFHVLYSTKHRTRSGKFGPGKLGPGKFGPMNVKCYFTL